MTSFSSLRLALSLITVHIGLVLAIPIENNNANAYTGPGGQSPGGSVNGNPHGGDGLFGGSLLSILSGILGNAGNGGPAYSGDAFGGKSDVSPVWYGRGGHGSPGKNSGNAYTGAGGNSPGGSVNDVSPGLINLLSERVDDNVIQTTLAMGEMPTVVLQEAGALVGVTMTTTATTLIVIVVRKGSARIQPRKERAKCNTISKNNCIH
ncbi:hypothetical protein BDZ94DRAFT_1300543 [Collybia nuda]|uniref:Glycine-rich protein n=1 Tax=Collybia nuda TaxID=64659 RepID=A0A9P5XZD7_9AGAR|nr:hypothetical protein BDZ94DRAFT_1300543 [Collybia nuda]